MHRNAFIRVCLWVFVALVLVTVLLTGINGSLAGFGDLLGSAVSWGFDGADAFSAGDLTLGPAESSAISAVDVHWLAGRVNIEFYDGDVITVTESADRVLDPGEALRTRAKAGRLTIQFCAPHAGVAMLHPPDKTLQVRIPASLALVELEVDNVSSATRIDGMGAYVCETILRTVTGPIVVAGVTGDGLTLETVSGQIEAAGNFTRIRGASVSGSQTYRLGGLLAVARMESVSGQIALYLPAGTGFEATLESVSGSVSSDFADGRKAARYGDAHARIGAQTVSGNVTIQWDASRAMPAAADAEAEPEPSAGEPVPSSKRSF